ncbi:hypothetical protein Q4543_12545 [Salipiger sp. 1_MG-2023]|nr:hypothetical protein [Salipiger sp. 1_MG-2023]
MTWAAPEIGKWLQNTARWPIDSHVEQVAVARHGSGNVDVETFVPVRVGKANGVVIHRGAGDEALFIV